MRCERFWGDTEVITSSFHSLFSHRLFISSSSSSSALVQQFRCVDELP